jgi:hypothetical protein
MLRIQRIEPAQKEKILEGKMSFANAKSSTIEKSFQCFADVPGLGAETASLDGVVNGAKGKLVFNGPGTKGQVFPKQCSAEVCVIFGCQSFHDV